MRRLVWALAALFVGLSALPFAPGVSADGLEGVLSAEAEAYALRVEYDIPLPLGPGTIPHVVGEVRRSQAGENAKGIAGAPTHFDAVVGGTYYDPDKENKGEENLPPQTECFYPGNLLDTHFAFPSDTKPDGSTKPIPPTSFASARCAAGPEVELRAVGQGLGTPGSPTEPLGAALSVGTSAADALIRPAKDVLGSAAAARAEGISIGGGAITIAAVEAAGRSQVSGKPGSQATESRVSISEINAGGTVFSIRDDQLVVGGQAMPLSSDGAAAVVEGVNAGLAGMGCRLDLLTKPARYPQGFLFSRPDPQTGLDESGRFAGSMKGGLVVLCDLPEATSAGTDFKPQRLQVVVGFVYTGASAEEEAGGFGIGDLGGVFSETPLGTPPPVVAGMGVTAPLDTPAVAAALTPAPSPVGEPPAAPPPEGGTGGAEVAQPILADFDMDPATRWAIGIVSLVVWAALTHAGAVRLRGLFS